jgi:hypothetical protein
VLIKVKSKKEKKCLHSQTLKYVNNACGLVNSHFSPSHWGSSPMAPTPARRVSPEWVLLGALTSKAVPGWLCLGGEGALRCVVGGPGPALSNLRACTLGSWWVKKLGQSLWEIPACSVLLSTHWQGEGPRGSGRFLISLCRSIELLFAA